MESIKMFTLERLAAKLHDLNASRQRLGEAEAEVWRCRLALQEAEASAREAREVVCRGESYVAAISERLAELRHHAPLPPHQAPPPPPQQQRAPQPQPLPPPTPRAVCQFFNSPGVRTCACDACFPNTPLCRDMTVVTWTGTCLSQGCFAGDRCRFAHVKPKPRRLPEPEAASSVAV
jgi:hypothetical protein